MNLGFNKQFIEQIVKFKNKVLIVIAYLSLSTICSSCVDTFGTDPSVIKIPIDPIDTAKNDKIHAKWLQWHFKEVVGSGQITEWPSSITYHANSAMLDTVDGRTFIWIDMEMKANFITQVPLTEINKRSDRVEYLKIKVDSLEVLPNKSYSLNDFNQGRWARIELYSYIEDKKYSFDGKDLISRIRFEDIRASNQVNGSFIFDFQLIDYIHTMQFIGNFSISY